MPRRRRPSEGACQSQMRGLRVNRMDRVEIVENGCQGIGDQRIVGIARDHQNIRYT